MNIKKQSRTGNAHDGIASDMADKEIDNGAEEATVVTVNLSDRPLAAKKAKEQEEARKEVEKVCYNTIEKEEVAKLKANGVLVHGMRQEVPGVIIYTLDVTPDKAKEILSSE